MSLFGKKNPLDGGQPLTPVERLCKLQEENNGLLRELLVATLGRPPQTPRASQAPLRTYTDKDVTVVNRSMRIQQEQQRQEQTAAPWRTPVNGPGSETTSATSGLKSNAGSQGVSPAGFVPTPDGPLPTEGT